MSRVFLMFIAAVFAVNTCSASEMTQQHDEIVKEVRPVEGADIVSPVDNDFYTLQPTTPEKPKNIVPPISKAPSNTPAKEKNAEKQFVCSDWQDSLVGGGIKRCEWK
jgi:hypothetical protein